MSCQYTHQYNHRRDEETTNLWNDLEPSIDADTSESFHNGRRDFLRVTVLEPERQKSKRILQRISRRKRNRPEESLTSFISFGSHALERQS